MNGMMRCFAKANKMVMMMIPMNRIHRQSIPNTATDDEIVDEAVVNGSSKNDIETVNTDSMEHSSLCIVVAVGNCGVAS